MMLDRRILAILREVDRAGGVTAAAERLNLSQSALSHTMRKFEECYGIIWASAAARRMWTTSPASWRSHGRWANRKTTKKKWPCCRQHGQCFERLA